MKKFIAAIALAAIASVSYGQTIDIIDGHINIKGDVAGLAGIEAISPAGHLSLDSTVIEGIGTIEFKTPFPASASVVDNTANSVVLGVLGADARIDISGTTATAIGYAESVDVAKTDLTVNLGIGDNPPAAFPVVPEPATGLMAAFGLVGILGLRRRR